MTRRFEPALTVRDVAAFLNVDEKTIYRLAQRGELPGFKVAGSWRFQRKALDEWINKKTTVAPTRHARRKMRAVATEKSK
jgi:excisionase family DNA binding protein